MKSNGGSAREDEDRDEEGVFGYLPDAVKSAAPYLLTKAARLQAALFRARTVTSEVTPAATYILYELTREEPLTPKDLSQRLSLGPAAIGQTLTRLERSEMITRDRSGPSRRWVQVRLTEKGRAVVPDLKAQSERLLAEIKDVLGADDEGRFVRILQSLIDHYDQEVAQEGALTYARATNATGTDA